VVDDEFWEDIDTMDGDVDIESYARLCKECNRVYNEGEDDDRR